MAKRLSILPLIWLLMGCTANRLPVVGGDTIREVREVARDSIVTLPADSSFIRAWFECDSLNQVIMTELETKAGKLIQPSASFRNGLLVATAKIDSQAIYLRWKERHESTQTTSTFIKEVEVEKLVYKKPGWLKILAGLGAGAVLTVIGLIIKKFK